MKTLVQSGDASLDDLSEVLEETFNQTYPVIRGSYAVMRYLMQSQDVIKVYVVTIDGKKIAALEKKFQKTLKKAEKRLKRIRSRVRDDQSKAEIKTITSGLSQLSDMVSKDDGLFPIYKDSLAANVEATSLKQTLSSTR